MTDLAGTFEITIQHRSEDHWPVVVEWVRSEALPIRREGRLNFGQADIEGIKAELRGLELDPGAYGELLGKTLFHETVRDLFMQALAESEAGLRVLLVVEDRHLKVLHWERLCAPIRLGGKWDFLARDQRILFSMYLPSLIDRRFPSIGRKDLQALIVIADPPENNDYSLAPFDAEKTAEGIRAALGDIPHDILGNIEGAVGLATLDALCARITGSYYTLLHITAHGWFNEESGETILYLLDDAGNVAPVPASRFLERFDQLDGIRGLPHFAFLSTSDSCAPEAECAGALGGMAQRMVSGLGMPAVVAMTQKVSITTAGRLSESLYARLRDHGEVDRALVQACVEISDASELTIPALYSRLGSRPLFSDSQERPLDDGEIEHGLNCMEPLLSERAPVMSDFFAKHAETLKTYLGTDRTSIPESSRQQWQESLDTINGVCHEVLDVDFRAVALDKGLPAYDGRCPFPGLYAFTEDDREFFFGRELLIRLLMERIENSGFLAILGPSGSGKSSVVLAGLIPAFRRHHPDVRMGYMTPGNDPIGNLDKAASCISDASLEHRLLTVDQFEELFTHCPDGEKRREFIRRLLAHCESGIKVILTLRADFWGDCAVYPQLKSVMQDHQELIAPMNITELRSAMEQQASVVGLKFEADLSHTILSEVSEEPGAMPLLQHLLQELWKRRHGRWLRAGEYRSLGGIRRAIAYTADDIFLRFPDREKDNMRNIFIRLTRLGDKSDTGEEYRDTRRRVPLQELVPIGEDPDFIRCIVSRLAGVRLVNTLSADDETEVEVSHEALIRYWPRLQKWLEKDRHSLEVLEDIRENARVWDDEGRQDNLLPRWNTRLEEAAALLHQSRFACNQLENDFITACVDLRDRETAQQQAYLSRLKKRLFLAVAAVLIATVAGIFAIFQWHRAVEQKAIADAKILEARHNLGFVFNEKAKQSLYFRHLNHNAARIFFYHALADLDPEKAHRERAFAIGSIMTMPDFPLIFTFADASNSGTEIETVCVSQNGKIMASGASDGIIRLYDMVTGKAGHKVAGHQNAVLSLGFSPDGQTLASGSADGTICLWDVNSGQKILDLQGDKSGIRSLDFSPDGKILASGSNDHGVRLWDIKAGTQIDHLQWHMDKVYGVGFSPDGKTLTSVSADNTIHLWNVETRKDKAIIQADMAHVSSVCFSPDGRTLASGSGGTDLRIYLWDVKTGVQKKRFRGRHTDTIRSVAFAPDGKTLASGSADHTIRLWDVETGRPKTVIRGHAAGINSVNFSADGKVLVSGADDGIVRLWNVESGTLPLPAEPRFAKMVVEKLKFQGHTDIVRSVGFSPDGTILASGSPDNTVRLWDPKTGKEILKIKGYAYSDTGVCFAPDGKTLACGATDSTIRLWDTETGAQRLVLGGHPENVWSISFSPDGKTLAAAAPEKVIRLWNLENGQEKLTLHGHSDNVKTVCFSPEGKILASGSADRTIRLWYEEKGQEKRILQGHAQDVNSLSFSPDGKMLASGSDDRTVRIWNMETGKERMKIDAHRDAVTRIVFDPDGKLLASASIDHTIRIWDVETGTEKLILEGHAKPVRSVSFSPDGMTIVSASDDKTIRMWDLSFFYQVKDTRLSEEKLKSAENLYNLKLVNLGLKTSGRLK